MTHLNREGHLAPLHATGVVARLRRAALAAAGAVHRGRAVLVVDRDAHRAARVPLRVVADEAGGGAAAAAGHVVGERERHFSCSAGEMLAKFEDSVRQMNSADELCPQERYGWSKIVYQ